MFVRPIWGGTLPALNNLIEDSWDLTDGAEWVLANTPQVVLDQQGLDGVVNTGTLVYDDSAVNFESIKDTTTIPDDSLTYVWRFFIRKNSNTSTFPQFDCDLTGGTTQRIHLQLNQSTGAMAERSTELAIGTVTYEANEVTLGGLVWWELIISVVNNGSGNTSATTTIYPGMSSGLGGAGASIKGAIRVGNVELYNDISVAALRGRSADYSPAPPATTPYYDPLGVTYADGARGRLSPYSNAGNLVSCGFQINKASFAGGVSDIHRIINYMGDSGTGRTRCRVEVFANDHPTPADRDKLKVTVHNSVGTVICRVATDIAVMDGADHSIFFSYDSGAGTVMLYVDGVDHEDASYTDRILTTGTMTSGAAGLLDLGNTTADAGLIGTIGHCWIDDSYHTNPLAFYNVTEGAPILIDKYTWVEFDRLQPDHYAPDGDFGTANLGQGGVLTEAGTITGPA